MRICYVSHTASLAGGGEHSLLELMGHLSSERLHQVALVCPSGPLSEEVQKRVSSVEHYPLGFESLFRTTNPLRLARFGGAYALSSFALRRIFRDLRPQVIHANSAPSALYAGGAAIGLDIPVVWHMRDIQPRSPAFRVVLPLIGRLSARVIAISEAVRENLIGFGVPAHKIRVFHNRVRSRVLRDGAAFRERWRIPAGAPMICVIGEILPRKGQLIAVRALARLPAELPVYLVLCGGTNQRLDYAERLNAEIHALGLDPRVVRTGHLADPGPALDAADLVLVASEEEPFGRVVVEAMLAGKPLVATRVGGIPEIVRDRYEALLVPAGDHTRMAAAIQEMVTSHDLRCRLADAARARAKSAFTWELSPEEVVGSLYGEIVHD